MIVSRCHKFVFVAIPKTGTHSIREALRPHLQTNDWEQCRLFVEKVFPIPPIAAIRHGHISCTQIRQHLHPAMWESYLKFCVVRNPFDRFVSYCHFINRDNQCMTTDALGTMKRIIANAATHPRLLVRPQFEFVTDGDGTLLVDQVCRVEDLQHDFDRVTAAIGLPRKQLGQKNTSVHQRYQDCYDDELRTLVGDFYHRDLTLFGYSFEETAQPSHRSCA